MSNYPAGVTDSDFDDHEARRRYAEYAAITRVDGDLPLPYELWLLEEQDDEDD